MTLDFRLPRYHGPWRTAIRWGFWESVGLFCESDSLGFLRRSFPTAFLGRLSVQWGEKIPGRFHMLHVSIFCLPAGFVFRCLVVVGFAWFARRICGE